MASLKKRESSIKIYEYFSQIWGCIENKESDLVDLQSFVKKKEDEERDEFLEPTNEFIIDQATEETKQAKEKMKQCLSSNKNAQLALNEFTSQIKFKLAKEAFDKALEGRPKASQGEKDYFKYRIE